MQGQQDTREPGGDARPTRHQITWRRCKANKTPESLEEMPGQQDTREPGGDARPTRHQRTWRRCKVNKTPENLEEMQGQQDTREPGGDARSTRHQRACTDGRRLRLEKCLGAVWYSEKQFGVSDHLTSLALTYILRHHSI